jgi:hypothetical protein
MLSFLRILRNCYSAALLDAFDADRAIAIRARENDCRRYHRIAERGMISRHFVDLASRFLECAMFPLMLSITVDLFLLARLVLDNTVLSAGIALVALLMFFGLWYVFPVSQGARTRRRHRSGSNPAV